MASSKPVMSFNDDVGSQIDQKRYAQQFFVNKRGLNNHSVDPFARTHMVRDGRNHHQFLFPRPDNPPPPAVEFQTTCCNTPAAPIVMGKKEDLPLEEANRLWTELRTQQRDRRRFTPATIGLDQTENN